MKIFLSLIIFIPSLLSADNELQIPEDPRQSINYWKSYAISAEEDEYVGIAEGIFARLLRGWDRSRVEPGLYVVRSGGAAWAASLADGNILLSREAISASFRFGKNRGEHLLAFVLAHELAHQRSDDLWHQRFFRSLRNQDQKQRNLMLNGLALDAGQIADIEQKEIQADHDGLIMMSSVGFDPWQVVTGKDFFTGWVESIWQETCQSGGSNSFSNACRQARSRALRTRSRLNTVASQSAIYDLGIQAMVANNYERARHYFTLFGREFPNRNVMTAIGMSYLGEALAIHRQLMSQDGIDRVDFYFPLLLDASAGVPEQTQGQVQKRSQAEAANRQLQARLMAATKKAAEFLERAIQLSPDHPSSYLSLAMAHLIENNPYLARGVLQGRYIPRFEGDPSVSLLLAMVSSLQGDHVQAERVFRQVLSATVTRGENEVLPWDILSYAVVYNLAALYQYQGRTDEIEPLWRELAKREKSAGNSVLFQLALKQLVPVSISSDPALARAPTVKGVRPGDRKPRDDAPHRISELWIEGEQFHVYIYEDGARYISASNGRVVSASQVGGSATIEGLIDTGSVADRALKTFGLPDRRLHLSSGDYLAYDDYRLALHIVDNRVRGWFLYQ